MQSPTFTFRQCVRYLRSSEMTSLFACISDLTLVMRMDPQGYRSVYTSNFTHPSALLTCAGPSRRLSRPKRFNGSLGGARQSSRSWGPRRSQRWPRWWEEFTWETYRIRWHYIVVGMGLCESYSYRSKKVVEGYRWLNGIMGDSWYINYTKSYGIMGL